MLAGILTSGNTGKDSDLLGLFVSPLTITSNRPTSASDTLSLKRVVSSNTPHQRWEIEAGILSTTANIAFDKLFFAGNTTRISIRPPQLFKEDESVYRNSIVNSSATRGSSSIQSSIALIPGSFINFSDHAKLYYVVSMVSGVATIVPPLITNVSAGSTILTGRYATMKAKLDLTQSSMSMRYDDGIAVATGTYKFIEDL